MIFLTARLIIDTSWPVVSQLSYTIALNTHNKCLKLQLDFTINV